MNDSHTDALVRATYEAVGDTARWDSVLGQWSDALGADSALLFTPGDQFNSLPTLGYRIDFDIAREFGEYYHLHDEWRQVAQSSGLFVPGRVNLGEELVPKAKLRKSLFYNDFLRRMDHESLMASVLFPHGNGMGLPEIALSFYRRPGQRSFGRAAARAMGHAVPHLQRSLMLHHELQRTKAQKALIETGLDQLPVGMVIMGSDDHVQVANNRARVLLREPREQHTQRPGLLSHLQRLNRLAQRGNFTGGRIETPHGPIYAVAAPQNQASSEAQSHSPNASVIWLIDQHATGDGALPLAASLFALTPTEQRVLSYLLTDLTPNQIAEQLGVKLSTVRTHISALLQKVGVRRQQELMRLMAVFPQT